MKLDKYLEDLPEYWEEFNCKKCNYSDVRCGGISCTLQCIKQYLEEKHLQIVPENCNVLPSNEFIDKIMQKLIADWYLDVDWNDYEKYYDKHCKKKPCNECKYYNENLCCIRLFLQYLKEKSL